MLPLALANDWPLYAGLLLLALLVGGVLWIAFLLLRLLSEGRGQNESQAMLEPLQAIEASLAELRQGQGAGLDLRRVEHLLVDLRDGTRRVHDRLLAASQAPAASQGHHSWPLADRIVARLLAEGYERIEILPPQGVSAEEHWQQLEESGGDVLVEARRAGAAHKGRVQIQAGAIAGTNLRPAHSIFP